MLSIFILEKIVKLHTRQIHGRFLQTFSRSKLLKVSHLPSSTMLSKHIENSCKMNSTQCDNNVEHLCGTLCSFKLLIYLWFSRAWKDMNNKSFKPTFRNTQWNEWTYTFVPKPSMWFVNWGTIHILTSLCMESNKEARDSEYGIMKVNTMYQRVLGKGLDYVNAHLALGVGIRCWV